MTTDKTPATLATTKPGGCVQLAHGFSEWWSDLPQDIGDLYPYDIAKLAWQAALSAQPSPGGQGDARELLAAEFDKNEVTAAAARRLRNHNETAVEAAALRVIAARQPVGESVAWKYEDKAADGVWEDRISEKLPCWEHRNPIPLYAVPPAQAMGLGQFRKAVEAWKRDAENKHRAGEIFPEQKDAIWKEADRLLALIESQAVGNG